MSLPDKSVSYYLAGPMSGIPQCNFPAFTKAAQTLRDWGYNIISPAELDSPDMIAAAMANTTGEITPGGPTWGDFLSRDVKIVADKVGGIILLDGWRKSRGAKLEVCVGLLCKHKFARFYNDTERVASLDPAYVAFTLSEELEKSESSNKRRRA
jgi:hypothetical protein